MVSLPMRKQGKDAFLSFSHPDIRFQIYDMLVAFPNTFLAESDRDNFLLFPSTSKSSPETLKLCGIGLINNLYEAYPTLQSEIDLWYRRDRSLLKTPSGIIYKPSATTFVVAPFSQPDLKMLDMFCTERHLSRDIQRISLQIPSIASCESILPESELTSLLLRYPVFPPGTIIAALWSQCTHGALTVNNLTAATLPFLLNLRNLTHLSLRLPYNHLPYVSIDEITWQIEQFYRNTTLAHGRFPWHSHKPDPKWLQPPLFLTLEIVSARKTERVVLEPKVLLASMCFTPDLHDTWRQTQEEVRMTGGDYKSVLLRVRERSGWVRWTRRDTLEGV